MIADLGFSTVNWIMSTVYIRSEAEMDLNRVIEDNPRIVCSHFFQTGKLNWPQLARSTI